MKAYQCRFCLDTDKRRNLISPCACKGTAKFIHNSCLQQWYVREPEKGLTCQTCKVKYASRRLFPEEQVYPFKLLYIPSIQTIYFINSVYFITSSTDAASAAYLVYQIYYQASMYLCLKSCLSKVQSKERYRNQWKKEFRWLLAPMLLICLTGIYQSPFYGFCLQLLEYMLFVEHFEILSNLNQQDGFEFISIKRRR